MIVTPATLRRCGVITPFVERTEHLWNGIRTTFGASYAGYDLRLDIADTDMEDGAWVIKPGQFVLASTLERFEMPIDMVAIVHDKSSWARRGLAVQNTVIEPGWRGYLTLELTNHSTNTLLLPQGCGIAQVIFHRLEEPVSGYDGKYQDQPAGPVRAK